MKKRKAPHVELSIIIVNWNSKDFLQKCLSSVIQNTLTIKYEIIVVDSASFDGCGEMLAQHFPKVRFIQSQQNIGFGRSNNLGAKYANGDVLLFLNPDTEVLGDAIEKLYGNLLKLPNAGVIGCRLLNSDKSLQTSCVQPLPTILNQIFDANILHRIFKKSRLWVSATKFEGSISPVEVEVISGACMMIRRTLFVQVKGFSSDYFMYAEDLDLCYKTRMAGFGNFYIAGAEVIHHGGGSTQQKRSRFSEVMIPESVSRLLRKMHGAAYSWCYRLALSLAAVLRIILLCLLFPIACFKGQSPSWQTILSKWIAILRWGLGLEKWVHRYDQVNFTEFDYYFNNRDT